MLEEQRSRFIAKVKEEREDTHNLAQATLRSVREHERELTVMIASTWNELLRSTHRLAETKPKPSKSAAQCQLLAIEELELVNSRISNWYAGSEPSPEQHLRDPRGIDSPARHAQGIDRRDGRFLQQHFCTNQQDGREGHCRLSPTYRARHQVWRRLW